MFICCRLQLYLISVLFQVLRGALAGVTSFGHYRILIVFLYFLVRYFSYALQLIPFSSRACHTLVCMSALVAVDVMCIISTVGASGFFSSQHVNCQLHLLSHFRQSSRAIRRPATNMEQMVITMIIQRGELLSYSLSIYFRV